MCVDSIKAIEQFGDRFCWDTTTGIRDFENGGCPFLPRPKGDGASCSIVMDGVGEQVIDHLMKAVGVPLRRSGFQFGGDGDGPIRGHGLEHTDGF